VPDPEASRPAGVIFDLDGTLVDTVGARIAGWIEALKAAGIEAGHEQIAPMIGMDGKRLARELAIDAGRRPTERPVRRSIGSTRIRDRCRASTSCSQHSTRWRSPG
jgi:beta-phosphoglucomutase-like phosphatase (HAD superfamily)